MPGILMRGVSHFFSGIACQDAGAIVVTENHVRIMVLSDGCSGSKYALQAAVSNCKAVVDLFRQVSLETFLSLPELVQRIIMVGCCTQEIARTAKQLGEHRRSEYAATLLVCVQDAEGRTLLGHLGDGAIYAKRNIGLPLLCSEPESVGKSTYFTVSLFAVEKLRLQTPDGVTGVLLTTDGADNGVPLTDPVLDQLLSAKSDEELRERLLALGGDHTDDWGVLTAGAITSDSARESVLRPDQRWEEMLRDFMEGKNDDESDDAQWGGGCPSVSEGV